MSGRYTDFWRLVKPAPSKTNYVTANSEAAKLYSNFSWYTKVMKGAASRFGKYQQYKNMITDVFVSRAIDTIAEEMTSTNAKTNMLFEIMYQNENNKEVPETVTMTVRAALRHWSELQDFNTIMFDIARTTVVYGDCFFQKTSDFKKWKHIDSNDVIGISISDDGKPEHYHVRVGEKNKQGAFGDVVMVPAAGIVHFSLTSNMGENGPFGESVLLPVIKAFRHLSLLEDSVIIYRIVRAPERRVFFIDVGNMPPQRVKAYLDAVRNEMKQKHIPNESGGTDRIDSVYNPISQTQDYFFGQSCLHPSTLIDLLDGRRVSLKDLIDEHSEGKQNYVYSLNKLTHELEPGLIKWAGYTRKNAELVRVHLDNGEHVDVTPDHRFIDRDGFEIEAQHLEQGKSLMPLYLSKGFSQENQKEPRYMRYVCNATGKKKFVHLTMCTKLGTDTVIHHIDHNSFNNVPTNLVEMDRLEHTEHHRQFGSYSLTTQWADPEQSANGYEDFKLKFANNHKVVRVEFLKERADTCDLTIESPSDSHLFALAAGVYVHNSDGRGSRVETLAGGENLGQIDDLSYFQDKFLQGLRIPSSYMRPAASGGAQLNEGKVGIAYIEELRFANYVSRLQSKINDTFDAHFKAYLKSAGIKIEEHLFKLKLVDPQNFKNYKQAEVDEKMIGNYSNVKDVPYLSERYKQMHYLGLSEDDIQENEVMLKQERGIPDKGLAPGLNDLRMMYDSKWVEGRPDIKVSDEYDNFEKETTTEPEEGDDEESGDEGEGDEKGKGDEKGGDSDASGGSDAEDTTTSSKDKDSGAPKGDLDSLGKDIKGGDTGGGQEAGGGEGGTVSGQ
jgi:hypothetical protein